MSLWEFLCCVEPHLKEEKASRVDDVLEDDSIWREAGIEGF